MGVRWKTLWRNPAIYLALAVSFWIALLDGKNHWVPAGVLILAFVGAFLILDILVDSWERRDGVQFFLVPWLLIALPTIGYVQLPSKYLVGSAPAVALILARLYGRSRAGRRFFTSIAVASGVVLSLLIIAADARFASFGKIIASQQIAPRVAKGIRVWENGEWGFEWYALKARAIPVANQAPYPAPGDVLVSSSAAPHLPLDRFPNRSIHLGDSADFIVRTHHEFVRPRGIFIPMPMAISLGLGATVRLRCNDLEDSVVLLFLR